MLISAPGGESPPGRLGILSLAIPPYNLHENTCHAS